MKQIISSPWDKSLRKKLQRYTGGNIASNLLVGSVTQNYEKRSATIENWKQKKREIEKRYDITLKKYQEKFETAKLTLKQNKKNSKLYNMAYQKLEELIRGDKHNLLNNSNEINFEIRKQNTEEWCLWKIAFDSQTMLEKKQKKKRSNASGLAQGKSHIQQNIQNELVTFLRQPPKQPCYHLPSVDPLENLRRQNNKSWQQSRTKTQEHFQELQDKVFREHKWSSYFIYRPKIDIGLFEILCRGQQHSAGAQIFFLSQENISFYQKASGDGINYSMKYNNKSHYSKLRIVDQRGGATTANVVGSPLSVAGNVAGGYVAIMVMTPRVIDDTVVLASQQTSKLQKAEAAIDLGVMAGTVWAFSKFVASKHPKTAVVIMIGSAATHIGYNTNTLLKKLEKGQRGNKVVFYDQASYLQSLQKPWSCASGIKPVFYQKSSAVNFQAVIKK